MEECIWNEISIERRGIGCNEYLTEKCGENCEDYTSQTMVVEAVANINVKQEEEE